MGKQLLFAAIVVATVILSMCLTPETNFFMSSPSKILTPLGTLPSHNLTLTPEPTTTAAAAAAPDPAAVQIETPPQ